MKAVKQIPIVVTTVDNETGKETHEAVPMMVMPPKAGACLVCAADHDPGEPHDADSLYYAMIFNSMMGRLPTWADAAAHCSDSVRRTWKKALEERGHWSEPPDGEAPVPHHGVND